MHGGLLNVRQDVVKQAARLSPISATVGVTNPRVAPAIGGKSLHNLLVQQTAQGELLEVVLALGHRAPSRAAWTAGSKSAIKMPMMSDNDQKLHQRKPRFDSGGLDSRRIASLFKHPCPRNRRWENPDD